jgi:hypothetical protein
MLCLKDPATSNKIPLRETMKPIEIEILAASVDTLAISIDYAKRGAPVLRRWYASRSVVEGICGDIDQLLRESLEEAIGDTEEAEADGEIASRLKSLGLALFQEVMQSEGDHLRDISPDHDGDGHLVFKIDRSLAHLPVEMMYDGSRFLAQRFAIGRMLYAEETTPPPVAARSAPYSALIVGDPSDDPAIRDDVEYEIDAIKRIYAARRDFSLKIAAGREVDQRFMLRELPGTMVFHFCGHGAAADDPDRSGIRLAGDHVISGRSLKGLQAPPSLVFLNMCTSASRLAWETSFGLAEILLRRGTKACVASLWDIKSRAATAVANCFHDRLLSGETFGGALRDARLEGMRRFGIHDLTWAAYTLYGNPTSTLIPSDEASLRPGGMVRHLAVAFAVLLLGLLILFPSTTDREEYQGEPRPAMGYVLVESTPRGARVYIDGEQAGVTPFAVELPVGDHRIVIERSGYRKWEAWVDVRETPRSHIEARLEQTEP